MKFLHSQIILYVQDMNDSANFYMNILGLALTYDGGSHWRTFDLAGTSLAIHPGGTGNKLTDKTSISLFVHDIESARKSLNQRGAKFGEIVNPHPGVFFCSTFDPDNNPIFLKLSYE